MNMNHKVAKIMGMATAISFLLVHIFIINVFMQCHVTPMVYFNVFSISFYAFMIFVAYKEWFRLFAVGVYMEVILHMTLAVCFTGWDNGFQATMLGMNVLALYAEYVGRTLKLKHTPMLPFCIWGMISYIFSYVFVHYNGYEYEMPDKASFWLTIIWAVITFAITLTVLEIFVWIVNSSEDKLEYQMSHDKLTGLPNRYFFSNYVKEIKRDNGLRNRWIAISDIDDFKNINDSFGHNCGDYVLSTISDLFSQQDDVLCCRWGGEEFIFVSPYRADNDWGYMYLDKLRKEVENYEFSYNGNRFHVTITIGMAKYEEDMTTDNWISTADKKLYEGKQTGKNKVVGE